MLSSLLGYRLFFHYSDKFVFFIGLVRSPVSATLPQIGSRLFLTWGVLWSFPEVSSLASLHVFIYDIHFLEYVLIFFHEL
jgi:hypothetical protein